MKKILNWEDWYTVFSLEDPDVESGGLPVDVDEALWERYRTVQIEFDAVQGLLAELRK